MMESSVASAAFQHCDDYSKVEIQKLEEFRKRVGDILERDDQKSDSFLIRWLRARNLDLTKAEEMLRNSMKWRKDNEIDTILEREDIPEDVISSQSVAFCGISEQGYGVFLVPFGRHDARYALEKYGLDACQKFQIINMEKMIKLCEDEGKKHGKQCTQIIEILDCEGYSYRQMSSKLCREFMAKIQVLMDNQYPEVLRYAMVVNTPKIFAVLFGLIKPFMSKRTLEKLDIYGPEPEKWKPIVAQRFPVDRIPPYFGGTMEGVDEYCSGSDIWVQGPKDLRAYMHGLTEADADFHKTTVNARDKFVKTVEVPEKGTILEWKFKTDNHDIAFQLTLVPCPGPPRNKIGNMSNGKCNNGQNSSSDPTTIDIQPYGRVDAHNSVQEGSYVCDTPGKYSFIFDNSFSVLKAKTLLYQINVVDTEHQEHPEKFEDCPEM